MPLTARKSGARAYFSVGGPDVEPPEWYRYVPPYQRIIPSGPRERKRYYAILAAELWNQKQTELSEGLDAQGLPLAPVKLPRRGTSDWHRRKYRKGTGPPLMPFRIDSRTRNLLRVRSNEREAVVYWAAVRAPGEVLTWAEILIAHAEGKVRGAPIRDVIGLSPDGTRDAISRAIRRYRAGSSARPLQLPNTTRWNATRRESNKPQTGGDPFDVRFRPMSVVDRVRGTVMRFFQGLRPRQAPPIEPDPDVVPELVPAGEIRVFRRGDRWLVIRGRRAWVIVRDRVRRYGLASVRGQRWTGVPSTSQAIPMMVRMLINDILAGGEG